MPYLHVLHPFSPHTIVLTSLAARGQQLKAIHKILTRQPPPLAGELQLEQSCENLGRGQLRLQAVHNLVDVRGFIRFEQSENPSLARAEWVVNWE